MLIVQHCLSDFSASSDIAALGRSLRHAEKSTSMTVAINSRWPCRPSSSCRIGDRLHDETALAQSMNGRENVIRWVGDVSRR